MLRCAAVGLIGAALVLAGCDAARGGETAPTGRLQLISGARGAQLSAAQLGDVRRAALGFSHSYAAAIGGRAPAVVADATPALSSELRAVAAQVPPASRGGAPRILGLALDPAGASLVRATVTFRDAGGSPFPIVFWLRPSAGRWLAMRLPGN